MLMLKLAGFKGCILRLEVENKKVNSEAIFTMTTFLKIKTQVVDDQSGLAGYGSEIDFTDPRLLKDHGPSVRCMDTCLA